MEDSSSLDAELVTRKKQTLRLINAFQTSVFFFCFYFFAVRKLKWFAFKLIEQHKLKDERFEVFQKFRPLKCIGPFAMKRRSK